jgi:hypothetical protein
MFNEHFDKTMGIALGLVAGGFLAWNLATVPSDNLIFDCQKQLPRNEVCVLKAVPQLIEDKG